MWQTNDQQKLAFCDRNKPSSGRRWWPIWYKRYNWYLIINIRKDTFYTSNCMDAIIVNRAHIYMVDNLLYNVLTKTLNC